MSQQTTRAAAHAWWVTGRPELNDLCPLQLILGQGRLAAGAEEPTKYQAEMLAEPWNKRYARLLDSQCMPDDEMSPAADNDTRGALTDEGAMRIALQIMANLENRNGVLDDVDDETKADIADEIAVAIRTALAAPSLPAGDGLTDEQRGVIRVAIDACNSWGCTSIANGLQTILAAPRQMGVGVHDKQTMFIVRKPGLVPRLGRPLGELAASLRKWYEGNPGAEIDLLRVWGTRVGTASIEDGREWQSIFDPEAYKAYKATASAQQDERISFDDWYAGLSPQWKRVIDAANGGDSEAQQVQADARVVAKLAEIDAGLDFEPDDQHTIADMANVGRALMKAIETHRPDYSPMCCPSEIVGDLCNELDEARAAKPNELSERQIEEGWHKTFSTNNPYCPCNLKSFTKAVRWAEHAIRAAMSREQSGGQ